ncbi:BZ3500_MvSof-1268-A1-R1_Chr12-2g03863 [Microbotryum saponariae]|uniref:Actin-related protein 2/3 complex subunit 5 n=1 Tax=Microbotryum saponariae TaxID=289078 RepID=A0A2X0L309_9BASI|nr:BZ3500_MvSof-1268-A1-R1_Chr12-2g03863 [Microbotryum saponariae]SCZ99829.1 BZ3501_MvSof-1269-A2-R1_Chr12-2g03517 [Microbotryum saponariae]
MSSSLDNFRRLDVDQYDPDRVLEHELYTPDPRPVQQVLSDTQTKASNTRAHLQRGDVVTALHEVLDQAPYGEGVQQAKMHVHVLVLDGCYNALLPALARSHAIALQSVLSILNSTRSTDIPQLIQALDPNEKVTLMKYLYKAMENLGETSGNVVLGWHEKVRNRQNSDLSAMWY